ncbi:MAG: GNAT family N-acetyltransferase [Proteobacteria bacterium]|jgi:GNAT superfamily N-acetyltransferase|nr:GNAT family N-acetyltransferase [Pseudomonadota bacterium]
MAQKIFSDGRLSFEFVDVSNLDLAQDVLNHNGYYHTSIVQTQPTGLASRCLQAPPPPVSGSRVFKKFLLIRQETQPVAVIDMFVGFPNYKTASIAMFMVHDGYQRKGIARQMLTHALPGFLKECHPAVETIAISVTDNNIPALRCLLECQYERTNAFSKLDANGKPIVAVTFKRRVADALAPQV